MSVSLRPRHIELFADIGEHGGLDTLMVKERHYPTVTLRRCQQKLLEFQRDGFLRSTNLTVCCASDGNLSPGAIEKRVPAIHCITERAAAAVEDATGIWPARVLRSDPKPETLLHRRACVQARLAFDASCAAVSLPRPNWILESDARHDLPADVPPNHRSVLV